MSNTDVNSSRYINNPLRTNTNTNPAYTTGADGITIKNGIAYICIPDSASVEIRDISVPNTATLLAAMTQNGFMETGQLAPIDDFKTVSDGAFQITQDGSSSLNLAGIDTTTVLTYTDLATIIQAKVQIGYPTMTVDYVNTDGSDKLRFTSGTLGDTSSVSVLSTVSPVSGTDISVPAYLNGEEGFTQQGQTNASGLADCQSIITNDSGSVLYIACVSTNFLNIYDIQDNANPSQLFSSALLGNPRSLNYKDDILFVASGSNQRFDAYNVSNPSSPSAINNVITAGANLYSDVLDNYAVCGLNSTDSVALIDISNPAAMTVLDTYTDSPTELDNVRCTRLFKKPDGRIFCIALGRNNSYLVLLEVVENSLRFVYQLTDPLLLTGFELDFISDQYCIVASKGSDSLAWIDISDVNKLSLVRSLVDTTNFSSIFSIKIAGYRAFVSNQGAAYFSEIDISNMQQVLGRTYQGEVDDLLVNESLKSPNLKLIPQAQTELNKLSKETGVLVSSSESIRTFFNSESVYASKAWKNIKFLRQENETEVLLPWTVGTVVTIPENNVLFVEEIVDIGNKTILMSANSCIAGYCKNQSDIITNSAAPTVSHLNPSVPAPSFIRHLSLTNNGAGHAHAVNAVNAAPIINDITTNGDTLVTEYTEMIVDIQVFNGPQSFNGSASAFKIYRETNSAQFLSGTQIGVTFEANAITPQYFSSNRRVFVADNSQAYSKNASATIGQFILTNTAITGASTEDQFVNFDETSDFSMFVNVQDNTVPIELLSNTNAESSFSIATAQGVTTLGTAPDININDGATNIIWALNSAAERYALDTTGGPPANGINNGTLVATGNTVTSPPKAQLIFERTGGAYDIEFSVYEDSGAGFVIVPESTTRVLALNTRNYLSLLLPMRIIRNGNKFEVRFNTYTTGTTTPIITTTNFYTGKLIL